MEPPKKNLVVGLGVAVNLALAVLSRLTGLRAALASFDYLLIPAIPGLFSPHGKRIEGRRLHPPFQEALAPHREGHPEPTPFLLK